MTPLTPAEFQAILDHVPDFVSVQTFRGRYRYVQSPPGLAHFVSAYRWSSEAAARRAGERDLAESVRFEMEGA